MRKSLLAALVVTLVACGGDKATGPQNISGSYTLQTVNGGSPPTVIYSDASQQLEVTDGTLVLSADHTWQGTLGGRYTDLTNGSVDHFENAPLAGGTYSLSGSTLTLNDPQEQLTFTGTVTGGTVTLHVDLIGFGSMTTLVYTR